MDCVSGDSRPTPSVYVCIYAKTEQARKAKLDDFLVTKYEVKSEDILLPCEPVM